MSSTISSPERIGKVTSDSTALGFDLLSNLTYMSVLTMGGLPRDKMLERSSKQGLKTAVFFDYVYRLAKTAGFEYTQAFKLVADKTRAPVVKSLLLRFSAAISSGESEKDFIVQETEIARERYKNEYERSLENLRKWTDAYAAILVSVTLVMVVCLISTIMASMNETFIGLMACSVFLITAIGVYVIYKAAPQEKETYDGLRSIPIDRRCSRWLLTALVPAGAVGALVAGLLFDLMTGCAVAFAAMGAALYPAGLAALKDDANVRDVDSELHTFLRSLGNIAGATGVNLTEALKRIDIRAMGFLGFYIRRLRLRLTAHLSLEACWERFREETGSELVNRTSHMLVDGSDRGGRPDDVGRISSDFALGITQLREKRRLVASTFCFLMVPMHATMVFILVFVLEILSHFNAKLVEIPSTAFLDISEPVVPSSLQMPPGLAVSTAGELSSGLSMFSAQNLSLISLIIVTVILVLTVANSLAPKYAAGGSNLKIAFFMSLMCLVSGAVLGAVPPIADKLFSV